MTFLTMRLKPLLVLAIMTLSLIASASAARAQDTPELPKIIRKSGGVLQASAVRRVEPVYPPLANAAKISGAVVVEVTIDEDGKVISARAISGHPLLKDAAVAAARGWEFAPTQLSGTPVKVIGTITFNFNLGTPSSQADDNDTQSDNVPAGVPGGVPAGVPGGVVRGVPEGVPGGVPGGIPGHPPARPGQPHEAVAAGRLVAALERSGYSYIKVSDGVWEIPATGKNLPNFAIRVTRTDDVVLLIARLADRKRVTVNNEMLVKLLEMNHRYDYVKVALAEDMLYVRVDARGRVLDGTEFNYAVEQVAKATDEIYAQVKPFIAASAGASSKPPVMPVPETIRVGPRPEPSRAPAEAQADESVNANTASPITVDSRPVMLSAAHPRYTEEARNNQVEGVVRVRALIGADGAVKEARVLRGLPDGLDEQAIRAVRQMKFAPAMKDGKPVPFWISLDVEFNLR